MAQYFFTLITRGTNDRVEATGKKHQAQLNNYLKVLPINYDTMGETYKERFLKGRERTVKHVAGGNVTLVGAEVYFTTTLCCDDEYEQALL